MAPAPGMEQPHLNKALTPPTARHSFRLKLLDLATPKDVSWRAAWRLPREVIAHSRSITPFYALAMGCDPKLALANNLAV